MSSEFLKNRKILSMDPSRAELQEKIKAQGDIVRKLKTEKVEKSLVRIMKFFLTIYFIIFEIARYPH